MDEKYTITSTCFLKKAFMTYCCCKNSFSPHTKGIKIEFEFSVRSLRIKMQTKSYTCCLANVVHIQSKRAEGHH